MRSSSSRRLVSLALGFLWVPLFWQAEGCNALLGNDSWTPIAEDSGKDGSDERSETGSGADVLMDRMIVSEASDTSTMPDSMGDDSPADVPVDTGLSPLLVLPPSCGASCDPAEGDGDCGSGETCRISSATGGTCDVYTGCEGHEAGWPCTVDSDCDDTLQCYKGECFALCPLGMTCAGGCDCFSVGNDTTGLCCPGMM
jgi:hypothetical protein